MTRTMTQASKSTPACPILRSRGQRQLRRGLADNRSENDHFFVSHPRTRGGAIEGGFDFDDIVIWASANEIIGQMAALGVMPIAALPGWPR